MARDKTMHWLGAANGASRLQLAKTQERLPNIYYQPFTFQPIPSDLPNLCMYYVAN